MPVQELTAYEEMSFTYPEFCQQMQMKITVILLQDVYVNPDSCFQKAHTLVRKGKALRVCGIERLKDCINCFSDAITKIVSSVVLVYSSNLTFILFKAHFVGVVFTIGIK